MKRAFLIGAVLAIGGAFFLGQKQGIGMALGIAGASFNLWAMWLMTGALGSLMKEPLDEEFQIKKIRIASVLIVLAFFSKLPIFLALSMFTRHLGGPALNAFLLGLGLVYLAMIIWALTRREQASAEDRSIGVN